LRTTTVQTGVWFQKHTNSPILPPSPEGTSPTSEAALPNGTSYGGRRSGRCGDASAGRPSCHATLGKS